MNQNKKSWLLMVLRMIALLALTARLYQRIKEKNGYLYPNDEIGGWLPNYPESPNTKIYF